MNAVMPLAAGNSYTVGCCPSAKLPVSYSIGVTGESSYKLHGQRAIHRSMGSIPTTMRLNLQTTLG